LRMYPPGQMQKARQRLQPGLFTRTTTLAWERPCFAEQNRTPYVRRCFTQMWSRTSASEMAFRSGKTRTKSC
jgi:hypothetical protein